MANDGPSAQPGTDGPTVRRTAARTVVGGRPSEPGEELAPGTEVGSFRIIAMLGAGGMGEVYLAEDQRLDRRVALKSIRAAWRASPSARSRFIREARVLSSLEHPGICRIYDLVETPDADFIVMELIDGETLDVAVADWPKRTRLKLAAQLARVMAVTHAAGVIHRDLKPANVMVTSDGEPKVLDFGIARPEAANEEEALASATLLTRIGGVAGTPMYMSPEQAAGEMLTPASDMYSFGLLLQELITGESPRDDSTDLATALEQARQGVRRPEHGVPRDVAGLIRSLTAKVPGERPTAVETAQRLERIRSRPRRRAFAAAAALIVLAAVAGGVKYTVDLERERSAAVEARNDADEVMFRLLEDIAPELRRVQSLDALSDAAELVMGYYERREPSALSEVDIRRYAAGRQMIGEARFARGAFESAEAAFADQRRLLEALLASAPDDGETLFALGQAEFYLGAIDKDRGQLDQAEDHFQTYLDVSERLVEIDPTRLDWLLEVAYAHTNLVYLHQDRGDFEASRASLDKSLVIKRELVKADPENGSYVMSLANGLSFLMEVEQKRGRFEEARRPVTEAIGLLEAMITRTPQRTDARYHLASRRLNLGELYLAERNWSAARQNFVQAQDVARRLVELDPSNTFWRREMAVARRLTGLASMRLPDLARAELELAAARRGFSELLADEPDEAQWSFDLVRVHIDEARLAEAAGRWDDVVTGLEVGEGRLVEVETRLKTDAAPAPAEIAVLRARLHVARGRERLARGAPAEAAAYFESALQASVRVLAEVERNAMLAVAAEALIRLDRSDEARPYVEGLQAVRALSPELEDLWKQVRTRTGRDASRMDG